MWMIVCLSVCQPCGRFVTCPECILSLVQKSAGAVFQFPRDPDVQVVQIREGRMDGWMDGWVSNYWMDAVVF